MVTTFKCKNDLLIMDEEIDDDKQDEDLEDEENDFGMEDEDE